MNACLAMADVAAPRWYVVRSNNRRERVARESLRAEGVEAYLPMLAMTNKKGDVFGAPMFTNFLFARTAPEPDAWRRLFSAHGVAGVLSACGHPSPLADVVIHRIRLAERDGYVALTPAPTSVRSYESKRAGLLYEFKAGDKVTIKRGVLAGLDAVFVHDVDGGRNSVLIQLLTDSPKLARIDPATLI